MKKVYVTIIQVHYEIQAFASTREESRRLAIGLFNRRKAQGHLSNTPDYYGIHTIEVRVPSVGEDVM